MASITDSVLNVLGIDKVNMDGKLLLIEEQHDSNANFLLSSVISNALKKDYKICFVLFHNTFNHYHSVGMKFGYNLTLLKEKGNVMVIEPMRIIASDMHTIYDQDTTIEHNLFLFINNECRRMTKENEHIIIIIDELNHLYNLGFDLKKSLFCMRYLRSLVEYNSTSQLCVVTHTYKHELQDCTLNTFAHVLKHMAHLHVKVEPFETGYTSDASGKLTINWKRDFVRAKYNWAETAKYIYKLLDRQVQIYAPGTAALLA